jgi:hypothetical protein
LALARRRDVPFVFTPVHHPRWGGWLHRHYHALYRAADAVIALTEAERQMLVGLGSDERRVFVTGIGPVLAETYDGQRFRAQHGLGDHILVLFLGQKYAYKDCGSAGRSPDRVATPAGYLLRLPGARHALFHPSIRRPA